MNAIQTLQVNTGAPYAITIGAGLLDRAGELLRPVLPRADRLFVVTDSNVGPRYADRLLSSLTAAGFQVRCHTVPAGEASKCPARLAELWEAMMAFSLTRSDGVVALGGGVVGDLAGFAAATVLRGVDFIQIPTTLLAQVDSSVGGKVAIDLDQGKNLAGAFWQPKAVLMDPSVLDTLPLPVFMEGMAEVVKYGCILDRNFFDFLVQRPSRRELMADIEYILYTCCDLKRKVVEKDERDTGMRMLLNFGHTLGHAYELAGHYRERSHGAAVAAGMCAAVRIGAALGLTPPEAVEPVENAVAALGLPTRIPCSREDYAAAIGLDKKGAGDGISFIVLTDIGHARVHRMPKDKLLAQVEALCGK